MLLDYKFWIHWKKWSDIGLIQLKDAESGDEILIDTSDKNWLKTFEEEQKLQSIKTKQLFNRANADFLTLDIQDSYIKTLLNFSKRT